MTKFFLLMIAASSSDMDVQNAEPFWVLEEYSECQSVADTLNKNADMEYVFCVASE